ncbi:MAG: hypothetical protein WCQ72_01215 [Eubacteriales bacterium]
MAKRTKKYKVARHEYTAQQELRVSLSKVKWKRLLAVLGGTIVSYTIFRVAIHYEFAPIYPIYYALLIAAFAAFVILNRGFSRAPTPREELDASWDDEKKDAWLADELKRKSIARRIMYIIVPLLVTFALDSLELFFFDSFISE